MKIKSLEKKVFSAQGQSFLVLFSTIDLDGYIRALIVHQIV